MDEKRNDIHKLVIRTHSNIGQQTLIEMTYIDTSDPFY